MLTIALTGGIATGKSYVRTRFEAEGVPTIDADTLAREAVAPGTPGLVEAVERFGRSILAGDGSLDRPALAQLVFHDEAARRDLEAIVHPRVRAAITAWTEAELQRGSPLAVADIPLLYETGRERDFDVVVVASCPPEVQVARVMARDKATEADARARLAAQWPIDEKVRRADFVVDTTGTFAETNARVAQIVGVLRVRADRDALPWPTTGEGASARRSSCAGATQAAARRRPTRATPGRPYRPRPASPRFRATWPSSRS
jgi:dephospho-CoA kinase